MHPDTPLGSDMIGTLVVCLPSQFSNGALVVKHHGVLQTFDWATDIQAQKEPTRLHWAAFFGDVDHQIERVWFGLRVTLTYVLQRGERSAPLPTVAHLHECEYSATGYFGNEGSETDFYTYGALHVEIPPYGTIPRQKSASPSTQGTPSAPRKCSSRKKA